MVLLGLSAAVGLRAEDRHWSFDPYAYLYYMTAYLTVTVNGVAETDLSDYEIAAFCGNECRGISKVLTASHGGQHTSYAYLRVWSNQPQGETIAIKVYQKTAKRETVIEDVSLSFSTRDVVGLPSQPVVLQLTVSGNIAFADDEVKRICVENWDADNDGELSYEEAAAVTDLGEAFKENTVIQSFNELRFFTGLKSLNNAFYLCRNLESAAVPEGVKDMTRCFFCCYKLKSATLPSALTVLGSYAFGYCQEVNPVELPSTLKAIEPYAFCQCFKLERITIPASVERIEMGVFIHCSSLETITVEADNSYFYDIDGVLFQKAGKMLKWYPAGKPETVYSIPEGTEFVDDFDYANNLVSIIVPASVNAFGSFCFWNCGNLKNLYVSNSNTTFCDVDGILFSKSMDAIHCYGQAREGDSYTVPESVTTIGWHAFSRSKLSEIILPPNLKAIEDYGFDVCENMERIVLPAGLTRIEDSAFRSCRSLRAIRIPSSVQSLGFRVFRECNQLASVTVEWDEPINVKNNDPFPKRNTATLYVPRDSKAVYEAAEYWQEFKEIRILGDANGDGTVSIADVTAIINKINNEVTGTFLEEAADVNGDGIISIADVTGVINIINK